MRRLKWLLSLIQLLVVCPRVLAGSSWWPSSSSSSSRHRSIEVPLTLSENDEEERILSALAKMDELSSTTTSEMEERSPAAPPKKKQDDNKLEYVRLPEGYRVQESAKSTVKQPQQAPLVPANLASPWVRRFLASSHKDALLPVPVDFWLDNFNLAQLAPIIERIALDFHAREGGGGGELTLDPSLVSEKKSYPLYRAALQLIIGDSLPDNVPHALDQATRALYCLVHQRYALSPRGLDMMRRRLHTAPVFGRCPNLACGGMPLLPCGDSDQYSMSAGTDTLAKRFCGRCRKRYYHWDSTVDGCVWGASLCHLFLLSYSTELTRDLPVVSLQEELPARIYGFALHPSVQGKV